MQNKDWFPTKKWSNIVQYILRKPALLKKRLRLVTKTAIPTIDVLKTITNKEVSTATYYSYYEYF